MHQNEDQLKSKKRAIAPGGYREVWMLGYPVVITMMSRTVMMFVDTAMVGRLGAVELAAVGFAGLLTWTLFSFFNGLLFSINTFVAQRYGSEDRHGCRGCNLAGALLGAWIVPCRIAAESSRGIFVCSHEPF